MSLTIKQIEYIKNFISQEVPNPNIEDGRSHGKCKEPSNDLPQRYNKAECEKVIYGENNTFIVLGRDRVGSLNDDSYGAKSQNNCGAIDIVAGRISAFAEDLNTFEGKVNPSFSADASRIYISQKSKVDEYFKICKGRGGHEGGKAAIAIKSDDVRLIARHSLKLVTVPENLVSPGDPAINLTGVQLIAGNDDSDLQPIPKGNNLVAALKKIIEDINKLAGIVKGFAEIQTKFNKVIAEHTHITTFYANETIQPHGETFKEGIATPLQMYFKVDSGLNSFTSNIKKTDLEFVQSINSTYHFLN